MAFDDEATATIPAPGSGSQQRVSLVIYLRTGTQVVMLDNSRPLVLGRGGSSEIVVDDTTVSRRHACFTVTGGQVWLEDMGSSNGTFVGGAQIDGRVSVTPEDQIRLGAVNIGLHVLGPTERQRDILVSHDRLLTDLEDEVERSRAFGRKVGLISVRAEPRNVGHIGSWCPQVQRLLRPFDRIAMYGGDEIEILVPEAEEQDLLKLAQGITQIHDASGSLLLCGFALLPDSAASADELVEATRKACQRARPDEPIKMALNQGLTSGTTQALQLSDFEAVDDDSPVVKSEAMAEVFRTIERLRDSVIPVLITGETGTGKEVIARSLHKQSSRQNRPLLCVNCGAIPGQLIESALFGHERGAFTGAHARAHGVFEGAAGGTVLLDEIGELPLQAQAALLRVLETKRVTRVGSNKEIQVDVRILAATNRDLEEMCANKAFRLDLLYRLNTMTLRIPPLRDRVEEIDSLVERFIAQANKANGCDVRGMDKAAVSLLHRYPWPGNVRELRNVIERAVVLGQKGLIATDALSERVRSWAAPASQERAERRTLTRDIDAVFDASARKVDFRSPGGVTATMGTPLSRQPPGQASSSLRDAIRRYEMALILSVLVDTAWNQAETARRLGMPIRTLFHKVKLLGLREGDPTAATDTQGTIAAARADLAAAVGESYKSIVRNYEAKRVVGALRSAGGDKAKTAALLGISARALNNKIKSYGL